jgi:hypothetical protein
MVQQLVAGCKPVRGIVMFGIHYITPLPSIDLLSFTTSHITTDVIDVLSVTPPPDVQPLVEGLKLTTTHFQFSTIVKDLSKFIPFMTITHFSSINTKT